MKETQTGLPTAASGLVGKPKQRSWEVAGVCTLLVIMVLLVFGQTLQHQFVNYDDDLYVYGNSLVKQGLTIQSVRWAFRACCDNWHPLTMISHMLACQLFGLWAGGHHLINLLLHATGAVLLFLMLREMTGALWCSAFVAAVFAIHPLRVESVAWVAERKDVLSGIFFMLTLWAYARYALRGHSRGRYAMVVVWFALGLLSKPMLVTVPCVLLLLDYWPLQRNAEWRHLVVEKLPLFALSAFSCVATVIAQKEAIQPWERFPLSLRVENALVAYAAYLGKLVYPVRLAVLHPMLKNGWPVWQVVAALLLLGVLTAAVFLLRRKQPYLVVGWLWYLGVLVPVIGILQVGGQAYADRYTYLPQIGLWIGVTWAVAEWAARRLWRWVALSSAAVVVLFVLLVAAYQQTTYWRDSVSLWTHTLGCTQDNSVAHLNLGVAMRAQGRVEAAVTQYREALRINPAYATAHCNLGNALVGQGRTKEALAEYYEALRINPDYADAHNNLGLALLQQGQTEEAVAQFREAVRINPTFAEAHSNLGNGLLQQGRTEEATDQYREALQIDPANEAAHNNLGNTLYQQGHTEEALAQFREALRIDPTNAAAHNNLGNTLYQQGHTEEALAQFREALRLDPSDAKARNNLGNALLQQGRSEEAIANFREALQINPADADAHYNLGTVLWQQGRAGEAIANLQKALELQPANADFQNSLAWMLATAPQASLRNGIRAVELATQASQSSGGKDPLVLDTLAAAYAEAGEFPNAVQIAEKALQQAQAQSNNDLASKLRREIKLYAAGQPCREGQ